ncbi:MAG: Rrf2 family transcriptional regulator [Bacillota bacterium]
MEAAAGELAVTGPASLPESLRECWEGMKLSTKGRYGVKAMYELARTGRAGPLPLHVIARRQGLSQHYLEQLVGPLREAGLVRSVRGAQGGYELARPPEEITVGDVVRILEGPIAVTDCTVPGTGIEQCGRAEGCVARGVWERVSESIARVLDSITLADLCREAGEPAGDAAGEAAGERDGEGRGGCPARGVSERVASERHGPGTNRRRRKGEIR